jgi:hypothetical protein
MDLDSIYLCWQGVASKQAYYVRRWDDACLNPAPDKPLAALWPAKVFCLVDREDLSRKPVLNDYLVNAEQRLVVSGRLKTFLQNAGVPDVEYLPVQVIDPSGLRLDDSYSIVHTLNSPDCLDLDACGARRSRVVPSKAEKIQRIVFKQDPERALFRPGNFNKITLVSWTLAEAIAAHGFTGFRFMGLFDYGFSGDLPPNPKRAPVDALCGRLWKNAQARP